jgi:transcriptional regulator with XRE-family HTH domain
MTDQQARPNRLRQLREERGFTQQDTADQLANLAWLHNRERVGVNADMVAKWERGAKNPSRRYRELLCLLFGVTADYLGLGPIDSKAPADNQSSAVSTVDSSLVDALGGAAAVLDQLGPAGGILQSRMFDTWKDDVMQRRALLKLLGLSPVIAAFPASAERWPASGKPTPENVHDLEHLADRYQALYHSTAPAALMTPVVAHLETLGDILQQGPERAERLRLLRNRARVATLAGRLAFFDLRNNMAARAYYSVALEAAREAGDHLQAAAALGHVAFIPASEHSFSTSLDYLHGAARHVEKHPHNGVASWLHAIESEMQTNAGSSKAALIAVDRAREALNRPAALGGELPWFDYYDATRLAGFAGYATLRAGRLGDAREALTGAVAEMPRTAVKQRAVLLADLATVELQGGDLDRACALAGDAADQLHQAGYATGAGRLHEFRAAVDHWKTSTPVRALDGQLAALR